MASPVLTLLSLAVVIVAWRQHLVAAADDPEIVFNSLYHVVFIRSSFLSKFQRCLCSESAKSCTLDYRLRGDLGYNYAYEITDVDEEDVDEGSTPGDYQAAYQCLPGTFGTEGEVTCTRLEVGSPGCWGWTPSAAGNSACRRFAVPTTHRACDFSCVDVLWSGYFVSYNNFPSGQEPESGVCYGSTSTPHTATAGETTTTFETTSLRIQNSSLDPGSGVSMKNEDGGGDNSAALGAGLGCAFIVVLVGAFVAAFVFWRRKRKRDASVNKPTLPYIPHLHANNTYSSASQVRAGARKMSSGETGSEYAAYLEPVHIYSHVTEDEAPGSNAVYENIASSMRDDSLKMDVANGDHNNGNYSSAVTSTAGPGVGAKQNPYELAASCEPATAEQGKKKKKKHGKKETGSDNKKKGCGAGGGGGGVSHDYNRLHTGRSGKGEEVSRSVLARYNNPPTPPSAPPNHDDDDDNSIYEGYDEEWRENERSEPQEPPPMNPYSMATSIDTGGTHGGACQTGQVPSDEPVDGSSPSSPNPYVNVAKPSPLGVVNPAFTPDKPENSSHKHSRLDVGENTTKKPGNGSREDAPVEKGTVGNTLAPGVYFELEKDNGS